jgi:ectoine hydroxylase-related dioxygenase (phytanoyl-CoA dioxygenase family)
MKTISADEFAPNDVVTELLDGGGAVRFPGLFGAEQVERARAIVERETTDDKITGSHFNQDDDDALLQRRVWNLFARGEVFCEMVQHPVIVETMRAFLGSDFIVGSMCASRTMPGFRGQEPHLDYPYWDFHREHSFPTRINSSFPLNCQGTILLDPFTEETGATAYRPGSQRQIHYPGPGDGFFDDYELMLGDPGDLVLFFGLTWHCAMPNLSGQGRTGILIEFLPKFVTPIEDLLSDLPDGFVESASPTIRQMLGFDYPWPSSPPHPPMQD